MITPPRSSTQLALPLDVCEIIIDILASDRCDPTLISVKTCSLVSRSFLPLCRKQIFARIRIDDEKEPHRLDSHGRPYHSLKELKRLIKRTPEIGLYVRHLELSFKDDDELDDFPHTLRCLTRLESLDILQYSKPLDWRSLKWPVRSALLQLIHLPTFTILSLCNIRNFLITDLVHGTNLRRLEIAYSTFFEGSVDAPSASIIMPTKLVRPRELILLPKSSGVIKAIATAKRSNGLPVIDLSELTTLSVECFSVDDMDALRAFLKQAEQLITFYLTVSSNLTFAGFGDVVLPHLRTLKVAGFSNFGDDTDDNPLGDIPHELAKIAGKNTLETLSIDVQIRHRNDENRDEWGMLDMVLTSSGWPALKTVSLDIILRSQNNRLVKLTNQYQKLFPRLSASKSVDFRLDVCNY